MVRIRYSDLQFDHIVVFNHEDTIFACCKENGNGNGKTRLFLVFGREKGRVYTRNGAAHSWELLPGYDAETVRKALQRALNHGITVYKFNGSSQTVTGQSIPTDSA